MDGEPGDFTVSEGHGHPLVLIKDGYVLCLACVRFLTRLQRGFFW
jgi:hypothetical protein